MRALYSYSTNLNHDEKLKAWKIYVIIVCSFIILLYIDMQLQKT